MKMTHNSGLLLIMAGLFASTILLGINGCGNTVSALLCTGTSCDCPAGESCDITDSECGGDSCSLDCTEDNLCTGECGASCSIDCAGTSVCNVTVGKSGSVSCTDDSECNVVCTTDQCSVSCSGDATCTLTCPGDETPQDIPEGGSCAS